MHPGPAAKPCSENGPPAKFPQDALTLHEAFVAHSETDTALRTALSVLREAIEKHGPDHIAVAFNGGKDATVVLHLTRAVLAAHSPASSLHCLYLLDDREFPAVSAFVRRQVALLHLDAVQQHADNFKTGIARFTSARAGMCAFVMGTRRTDPHGQSMKHFEPSSPGWPTFMRVNPILTWGYHDVWRFLKRFRIPYCDMYDHGYTSIGSIDTTLPNPALKVLADDGTFTYKPAYQLENESLERAGRICKKAKDNKAQLETGR